MQSRLILVLTLSISCSATAWHDWCGWKNNLPAFGPGGIPFPIETQKPQASVAVTSDSLPFCLALAQEVDSYQLQPSPIVAGLRQSGLTLCRNGNIRIGLTRLRRAVRILKGSSP